MNGPVAESGAQTDGFLRKPAWLAVLAITTVVQFGAALAWLTPDRSWRSLVNDQPVMCGRHPLHYYHGLLGANSWRDGGNGSCYDPAFQAGYPKTPVFDSGSRPAEAFLLMGRNNPAAYKVGLAACCIAVPLVLALAARCLELPAGLACLAAMLAQIVWWSAPTRHLLDQGDIDWLMAGLTLVLHSCLAVRFHRDPGTLTWIGLLATAALGWFLHPILWLGFAFLFLPLYLAIAFGHGWLWNLAIWLAWIGGWVANGSWLSEWLEHCWIHRPIAIAPMLQVSDSLTQWWSAQIIQGRADAVFKAGLLGGGLIGIISLAWRGKSGAALALGGTVILLPLLSAGSAFWEPLAAVGAAKLFALACLFASAPAAHGIAELVKLPARITHRPRPAWIATAASIALAALIVRHQALPMLRSAVLPANMRIGLTPEQEMLAKTLAASTRPDARILWEERPDHPTPSWQVLLPMRTERAFLGGLDVDAAVDHMYARLTSNQLGNRSLSEWTDSDLLDFCTRYNVGHIVCWSPEATARFRAWNMIEPVVPVRENGPGWLFAVRRVPSMVLKGRATVVHMDSRRIALADVHPDGGEVILSLHYQDGMRISPGTVTAERDLDPLDPIPLLRLRLDAPVMRLTITWGVP